MTGLTAKARKVRSTWRRRALCFVPAQRDNVASFVYHITSVVISTRHHQSYHGLRHTAPADFLAREAPGRLPESLHRMADRDMERDA